jgi:imidazole glycerol-phosphate synthase subunit HisF
VRHVRVIPVLLLAQNGIVKTVRFARPRYLGDPINAVKIFNEKKADELILLDIEATSKGRIAFDWVEDIISEAFMPIAYGGGITSVDQCAELFTRGVEKVVLNSAAYERPQLISDIAERFGSQSVVVSIDARRNIWKSSKAYIHGGRKATKFDPAELAVKCEAMGAGEIMLTSVAREGTFAGYDIDLLHSVSSAVRVPVVAHGGAGSVADFEEAVVRGGCSAVAAGSMFVFSARGEGVLITYPSESELEQFWSRL